MTRRQLILSTAVLPVVLAGCGQVPVAPVQAPTKEQPAAVTKAPESPRVKLIVVDTDFQRIADAVKGFQEQNPRIELEIVAAPWQEFDAKVDVMIAGKLAPALWQPMAQRGYRYYAVRGMVAELGPFIARDKYDTNDFFEADWQFCHTGGKPMALPCQHFVNGGFGYNKQLLDAAGMAYPPTSWEDQTWTWDRLLEAAKKLTRITPVLKDAVWGLSNPPYDGRHAAYLFGGDYFDEKDYETGLPKQAKVNRPETVEGLQFQADLIHKNRVAPNAQELADLQKLKADQNLFMAGNFAMTWMWSGHPLTFAKLPGPPWDYGVSPIAPNSPIKRKLVLYPDQWVFFKETPNQDQAWELMKYVAGPQGAVPYIFGANGKKGIPGRRSIAEKWKELVRTEAKLPEKSVQALIDAVKYSQVSASHAIPRFAEVSAKVIVPTLTDLWAGKITAREAVQIMEPKINAFLQEAPY